MKVIKHKHKQNSLDVLTYIVGPLMPLLTLPQVYTVLVQKQTEGVSLITWAFYLLASALFAFFGIKHKEKLLIYTYVPFVIIEGLIVIGLVMNRA